LEATARDLGVRIVCPGQLADLRVQRLDIGGAGSALGRGGEEFPLPHPRRELGLPLRDLVGVDGTLLGELGQGPVALQGGQSRFGLEHGCMIPSGTFHTLLSLWGRHIVPSQ